MSEHNDRSAESAEALRLLAAEDARQDKLQEIIETIREQIRLEVAPEHRPEGLFKNIQDAVYAMRGRTRLMDDAAITHVLNAAQAAGVSDGLAGVALQIAEKIAQLRIYRDTGCQLDHARTIAEGRIAQAEMDLRWVREAMASQPSPAATVETKTDTNKVWGAAEACWASTAPREAVDILYYEILRLNGGSVTGGDINKLAAPQRSSAATEDACRAHVAETALREIRRYADENLGPSRSSLLAKIAHTADAALALSNDLPQASSKTADDAIKALTGLFSILRGRSYARDHYQLEISHGLYNELRDVRDRLVAERGHSSQVTRPVQS